MSIHSLLSSKQYGLKKVIEKLIAHRLGQDVPRVLAHLDYEISDEDFQWIQTSYHSYAVEKQPLEYILGYVEFLGNKFMVDKNTLIPRPETEYMITAVLKELSVAKSQLSDQLTDNYHPTTTLIDVGTGCGVLGLSCILHGANYLNQVYLTEFYPETLEVARRNREKYNIERIESKEQSNNQQLAILNGVQLINCSLLDHPQLQELISNAQSDHSLIIVANLPYIPEQLFEDNVEDNVKLREPKPAFVGGEDGLDWYREMLKQIIVTKGPKSESGDLNHTLVGSPISSPITLFLEMMTRQVEILVREFKNHFSFEEVATFHMNIRIVKVSKF